MFVFHLGLIVCSALERALLEDGDVEGAIGLVDRRDGPLDYFYSYFVKSVFMFKREEALVELIGAPDHRFARSIVLGNIKMDHIQKFPFEAQGTAEMLLRVAARISKEYLRNNYRFLIRKPLAKLAREHFSEKEIENMVIMTYAGDKTCARLFLSLLDQKEISPGGFLHVLEFLAKKNVPRAFAYLGEIYYYGLGVKRSMDRAMFMYSKGKDLNDAIACNGVGKVLLSREYRDYESAEQVLMLANNLGAMAECSYLLHLLQKRTGASKAQRRGTSSLEKAVLFGYLPAIFEDGLRYYETGQYINACIRFSPILQYSDLVYDMQRKAEDLFLRSRHRQAAIALLMCVELGSSKSAYDVVYLLQNHSIFRDQDRILFGIYQTLVGTEDYKYLINMGDAYFYGRGTEKSHRDAFALYLSSAILKNQEGYFNTAYMYEHGYGTCQSWAHVFRHLLRIRLNDKTYLLLLYTYIRLFAKLVSLLIFNRYFLSTLVGLCTAKFLWLRMGK
jgi:uncharacterized protein